MTDIVYENIACGVSWDDIITSPLCNASLERDSSKIILHFDLCTDEIINKLNLENKDKVSFYGIDSHGNHYLFNNMLLSGKVTGKYKRFSFEGSELYIGNNCFDEKKICNRVYYQCAGLASWFNSFLPSSKRKSDDCRLKIYEDKNVELFAYNSKSEKWDSFHTESNIETYVELVNKDNLSFKDFLEQYISKFKWFIYLCTGVNSKSESFSIDYGNKFNPVSYMRNTKPQNNLDIDKKIMFRTPFPYDLLITNKESYHELLNSFFYSKDNLGSTLIYLPELLDKNNSWTLNIKFIIAAAVFESTARHCYYKKCVNEKKKVDLKEPRNQDDMINEILNYDGFITNNFIKFPFDEFKLYYKKYRNDFAHNNPNYYDYIDILNFFYFINTIVYFSFCVLLLLVGYDRGQALRIISSFDNNRGRLITDSIKKFTIEK